MINPKIFFTFVCLLAITTHIPSISALPCNGSEKLCNVRYNNATYAMSHNGTSTKASIVLGPLGLSINDQKLPLGQQMNMGIRATKVPLYEQDGKLKVCHGIGPGVKKTIYNKCQEAKKTVGI